MTHGIVLMGIIIFDSNLKECYSEGNMLKYYTWNIPYCLG